MNDLQVALEKLSSCVHSDLDKSQELPKTTQITCSQISNDKEACLRILLRWKNSARIAGKTKAREETEKIIRFINNICP